MSNNKSDKKEIINIALVGCGRISYNHFQAINDNAADFNLCAICDTDKEKAQAAATKHDVPYYLRLRELLESHPEVELVALCTPSGIHPCQSILASKYGKHVLTEKPMGCYLTHAQEMLRVANENNKKLFVVKQNRLNPTIQALKKAITLGSFGKIYMVHCNVLWTRPQEYYDHAAWRGTRELDGGALMNQASHYVDLLEWLVGPIKVVQAINRTLARDIACEDSSVVNFEWENGAIGSMAVTMLTYPNNLEGSITIIGEKGTVRLDGMALNEVKTWQFEDTSGIDIANLNYQPENVYGNGHGPYYKNVADVLLRDGKPISDGVSGLKSVRLLSAIYKAAKTGTLIAVSDGDLLQEQELDHDILCT